MKEDIKDALRVLFLFKKGITDFKRWFEIGCSIIAYGYIGLIIYILVK